MAQVNSLKSQGVSKTIDPTYRLNPSRRMRVFESNLSSNSIFQKPSNDEQQRVLNEFKKFISPVLKHDNINPKGNL